MIPESKINEIRSKASILEVISDYVTLKKSGKNYLGLCPFHSERTPSFTVNEEKGIFHCFGCGTGGNLFNFLMRMNQWTFPEAVREVARRYGIALPEGELSAQERHQRTLRAQLYEVNEMACDFFQDTLQSLRQGEEGRKYLAMRGLSAETIQVYRLGFAPDSWNSLGLYLQKKGVDLRLAEMVGLVAPRKDAGPSGDPSSFYDRFRRRVIFPIINETGRVCGFGGRVLERGTPEEDPAPPKYLNSPESPVYSKGHMLYGLNVAKGAIREREMAVIVEGYMDLLSLYQEGIKNVVASLGTALTPAQVSLLGRFTQAALLVFDADEGGKRATERSLDLFLQEKMFLKIATLPPGDDPDSFIRRERRAGFEKLESESLPLMEFLWQRGSRRHSIQTIEGKVRIVRELIPFLQRLPDPLEQNLYIERIAHRLDLKENQIRSLLTGPRVNQSTAQNFSTLESRKEVPHEKLLLQLMLNRGNFIPRVIQEIGLEGFTIPRYRRLAEELIRFWEMKAEWNPQNLLNLLTEMELRSLVSEMLLSEESLMDPERIFKDCLRQWRLSRVRQEIQRVDEEIRERAKLAAAPSKIAGMKELLKRKQRLVLEQKRWIRESGMGESQVQQRG